MTNTHQVQVRLIELGLLKGSPDGILGPRTKTAIRAFQRMQGLKVDGIVGAQTAGRLWPPADPERDIPDAGLRPVPSGTPLWPQQRDVPMFFGMKGADQVTLQVPYRMVLAWDRRRVVRQFSVHRKVHDSAARVFSKVAAASDAALRAELGLDLFAGCLNVRKMTGSATQWSMHSWGIAIDFDSARNPYAWGRDRARLARADAAWFWDLWEAEGWISLGRERNKDWMHVQAPRL